MSSNDYFHNENDDVEEAVNQEHPSSSPGYEVVAYLVPDNTSPTIHHATAVKIEQEKTKTILKTKNGSIKKDAGHS